MPLRYILLCILLIGCQNNPKNGVINSSINNKEALKAVIAAIKCKGIHNQHVVTDEEIAQNVLLSKEQLVEYLNGDKEVPDELVFKLLAYSDLQLRVLEARKSKNIHTANDDE